VSSVERRWPVVKLGDVADTALGKMLDRGKPRSLPQVPYLRNVNVQWGRIDTHDLLTMEMSDDERRRFAVEPGDLLVCEGGEIGRAAIWRGRPEYLAYQKALHRVRAKGALDLAYLRYLLELYHGNGTLARFATGSTIAHLPQQQLRALPVPLPSIDEQRRIVEILEDHLSRLDAAARGASTIPDRAEGVLEAWLAQKLAAVTTRPLQQLLAVPLSNGRSVPTQPDGFPVLRLTAISNGAIDLRERKGGAWTAASAAPFLVQEGDFLISRGNGSLKLVARGGLVPEGSDQVAFPDTMIRLRPRLDVLDPNFLSMVWNSRIVRRQIEAVARTTAGIYKVNQRHLQEIKIPRLDVAEQRRLAAIASSIDASAKRITTGALNAMKRSQILRGALLQAAFSGRLTGRGTDAEVVEEMASV
jgi:type I restriction enzyme, S subunit